jgi:hypothetical protein
MTDTHQGQKPALLVLAAGIGSRYGGLKQVDPVGPSGEAILDYSVYDALRADFGKIVFVIRKEIEDVFREKVGKNFEAKTDVRYVFQELNALPEGFSVPEGRVKPWGTGHAILVAEKEIEEPFAVINADDFYGPKSFKLQADFLKNIEDPAQYDFSIVGFILRNTLSEHGSVSRGVCETDQKGNLISIRELTDIVKDGAAALYETEDGRKKSLSGDELVSMNLWGFTPALYNELRQGFHQFLKDRIEEPKSEYYIVDIVNDLVARNEATVKVLPSPESWFGVTYTEDKPVVIKSIKKLVDEGVYPERLWG